MNLIKLYQLQYKDNQLKRMLIKIKILKQTNLIFLIILGLSGSKLQCKSNSVYLVHGSPCGDNANFLSGKCSFCMNYFSIMYAAIKCIFQMKNEKKKRVSCKHYKGNHFNRSVFDQLTSSSCSSNIHHFTCKYRQLLARNEKPAFVYLCLKSRNHCLENDWQF